MLLTKSQFKLGFRINTRTLFVARVVAQYLWVRWRQAVSKRIIYESAAQGFIINNKTPLGRLRCLQHNIQKPFSLPLSHGLARHDS